MFIQLDKNEDIEVDKSTYKTINGKTSALGNLVTSILELEVIIDKKIWIDEQILKPSLLLEGEVKACLGQWGFGGLKRTPGGCPYFKGKLNNLKRGVKK